MRRLNVYRAEVIMAHQYLQKEEIVSMASLQNSHLASECLHFRMDFTTLISIRQESFNR